MGKEVLERLVGLSFTEGVLLYAAIGQQATYPVYGTALTTAMVDEAHGGA